MELTVYKINGEKTDRTVTLDDTIFGIVPNDHAIYLDVKQIMANRRQGTHSTKQRSEVAGSTRKLKRQKGTGGARAGSIKNPIFRSGGRTFGPQPRVYRFKLNKKLKRLARKSALSYKAESGNIMIVEDFNFETPKTKNFLAILKSLNVNETRVLMLTPNVDRNIYLSTRNLGNITYLDAKSLNTYEVLKAKQLIILESSLNDIKEMFAN
ncbi:MAG: 50S ribosomal protein L4 [Bacteroidota bacterium]|jgi:large subunit ribosomal protein L4|nr:50S ribosomal protein L4 [Bacteroidales bacterium]MDI9592749.1 50S ribosomal protein L4 [Bacteroidota bacterium]HOF81038.1 50S ribosomal protein L4 [Bacteroidales bacterium]HOR76635.1 50S ribosomal protein L4 [Bacteroidales bacterium]HPL11750.1 50S ribosomal protein L4 [Bacteroidales bacterium]